MPCIAILTIFQNFYVVVEIVEVSKKEAVPVSEVIKHLLLLHC